jgi:hypothetical protein
MIYELRARATRLATGARAAAKTAVLLLKVYPMLPSRPLDWLTRTPALERFRYTTSHGPVDTDLYRPGTLPSWSAWASCRSESTIRRYRVSARR